MTVLAASGLASLAGALAWWVAPSPGGLMPRPWGRDEGIVARWAWERRRSMGVQLPHEKGRWWRDRLSQEMGCDCRMLWVGSHGGRTMYLR